MSRTIGMRSTASLVVSALLLAACGTSGASIVLPDSVAADPRVTVGVKSAFKVEEATSVGATDRMVFTARRDAKWTSGFSGYMRTLSSTSCPAGTLSKQGEAISIAAAPVPLQPLQPDRRKVGELTFVAGFHLTSGDKRFGGLSGLDILDNGNLLAVSDNDDFIWIDLAKDGVTPVAARIAAMHDDGGNSLEDADDGNAEGLAFNNGMALVSYDRDHRVLAYDVGKCGAAARGAPIAFGPFGLPLAEAYGESRIAVDDDAGSDAIGVTSDWYMFTGIETKVGQLSPMSARPIEADPDFSLRVGVGAQEFVGLDVIPLPGRAGAVRAFTLHRSFTPRVGYAVTLAETDFYRYQDDASMKRSIDGDIDQRARFRFVETGWRKLADLDMLMSIDNFEGVAAKDLADGRTRLFVVSDDNYSPTQRTLLMVFDLAKPLR